MRSLKLHDALVWLVRYYTDMLNAELERKSPEVVEVMI